MWAWRALTCAPPLPLQYHRYQSIGEIYYIWPEPDHVKDQLTLSSLVQAMMIKNVFAVVRWAQKETSAPRLGAAMASVDEDNVEYLTWVQVSGGSRGRSRMSADTWVRCGTAWSPTSFLSAKTKEPSCSRLSPIWSARVGRR